MKNTELRMRGGDWDDLTLIVVDSSNVVAIHKINSDACMELDRYLTSCWHNDQNEDHVTVEINGRQFIWDYGTWTGVLSCTDDWMTDYMAAEAEYFEFE